MAGGSEGTTMTTATRTARDRRVPVRTNSATSPNKTPADPSQGLAHARHKSAATSAKLAKLAAKSVDCSARAALRPIPADTDSPATPRTPRTSLDGRSSPTPPANAAVTSPQTESSRAGSASDPACCETLAFDFTKIDYELERARKLGSGLWSDVFLCEPTSPRPESSSSRPTPSVRSQKSLLGVCAPIFAVKVPSRRDAEEVLKHEANVLSVLQRYPGASQFAVSFFGLDTRNSSLVFEAVIGGSMEDLIDRLKHMTELARHEELVGVFPRLATDLIGGLDFIHAAGIVHADIKPQNILLDVSDHYSLPAPVIRARYIDFSAAALAPDRGDGAPPSAGGGTWDFMAPEQLRVQRELNAPTRASDAWSLGVSLLAVIVLGSPYAATCGGNPFMLREAVKAGDPMGFARMDPTAKTRMDACQDFVDCCKLALQKDRERRATATAWRRWLEARRFGSYGTFH